MGRWREAPLSCFFHVHVLVVQVHGQGGVVACATVQNGFSNEHKAHAGYAFKAFATGRNQSVKTRGTCINFQRCKRAHGIDDQALVVLFANLRNGVQGVHDAGTSFTMNQNHMGDAGVFVEQGFKLCGRHRLVLWGRDHGGFATHHG